MFRSTAVLLSLVLTLTGCGQTQSTGTPTGATAVPTPGGTLPASQEPLAEVKIGINGPVANLDPAQPMLIPDVQAAVLIAGQLFRFDANGEPQPDLVESFDVAPDGLVYTMRLHKGMLFSDGTPITAEDAVFSFERSREGPQVNQYLIQHLVSVEATDATTIVFRLSQPEPDFLYFFGYQWILIHPKSNLESDPDYFSHPISSGPYVLKDGGAGSSQLTLVANPNYVHAPLAISQLVLISVPDLTARSLQLAQGALDYVHDMAPSSASTMPPEVRVFPHPSGGNFALVINQKKFGPNYPLANRDVREAISLAVDRDQINQQAFFGFSQAVDGFMYPGAPEQLTIISNGGKADVAAAKALLATTPYASGFEFHLVAWVDRPGWQDATLVIKQNLAAIGITVTIDSVQASAASALLSSGDYEVQSTGLTSGTPALLYLNQMFAPGSSWANFRGYNDPQMKALFDKASVELDPAKRLVGIQDIQRLGYQDFSYIPTTERVEVSGSRLPAGSLVAASGKNFLIVGPLDR